MRIKIKANKVRFFTWSVLGLLTIFIASILYISFLNEKSAWETFGELCGGISKGCQEILYSGVQNIVNQKRIIIVGLIFLTLIFFINIALEVFKSNKYIKSFKVYKKNKDLVVVYSKKLVAFTAGFFRQRIYISKSLLSKLKKNELKAVILHEKSHILKYDNLKNLIFMALSKTLFFIPLLKDIQKINSELVESEADNYVIDNMSNGRKSILSSIFKFSEFENNQVISHFSSRSEKLISGREVKYSLSLVSMLISFGIIFVSGITLFSQSVFAKSLPETQCTERSIQIKRQNISLDKEISVNINSCLSD